MGKTLRTSLAVAILCFGWRMQASADVRDVSATVAGLSFRTIAEGSKIKGGLRFSLAKPIDSYSASALVDNEVARGRWYSGWFVWQASSLGVHVISHRCKDVRISASYDVVDLTCPSISYVDLKGATHSNLSFYLEGYEWSFTPPSSIDGYTFVGWSPSEITRDMTGPQTVTANWRPHNYTIKYDANGGEGTMPDMACVYDEEASLSSNRFTRANYVLAGWATEKEGPIVYMPDEKVKGLVSDQGGVCTLYAVWKWAPFSIEVSHLKATAIEPLGLAIDYTVRGVTEEGSRCVLRVSLMKGGTIYEARTLTGATNCANGAHRVYWNMAADGLSLDLSDAKVSVMYDALYHVIDLSAGPTATLYPIACYNTPPSGGFTNTVYKTTKLVLKRVEGGTFTMGHSTDKSHQPHTVTLTKPFHMGLFEVTQKQWELVTGTNACASVSDGRGDAHPVHYISYNDVRGAEEGVKWPKTNSVDSTSFLGRLRARTKLGFDLPTEAQWEYVCRAGTTTRWNFGDEVDDASLYMWFCDNAGDKAHEVGTKLPNLWGFYDMHGNVTELCLDFYDRPPTAATVDPKGPGASSTFYSQPRRVRRDGWWDDMAILCDASNRSPASEGSSSSFTGLRLALPDVMNIDTNLQGKAMDAVAVTTDVSPCRTIAEGSQVDGEQMIGYAPTDGESAIVTVCGDGDAVTLLNSCEAGSFAWLAPTSGNYAVTHIVGADAVSATYSVKVTSPYEIDAPNPPMEAVDGISLLTTDLSCEAAGGNKRIKFTGDGLDWTASVSADWLSLNSTNGTTSASGTSAVACLISENTSLDSRVGYVYVAGHVVTVTQAGRTGVSVSETQVSVSSSGLVGALVSTTCEDEATVWRAWSEVPWISVVTQTGTGSVDVVVQIAPWSSPESRTGKVAIAGQTVTVTQTGVSLAYPTETSSVVGVEGDSGTFEIAASTDVLWTVTSDADWLVVSNGVGARRGTETVEWEARRQPTFASRTATITVTPASASGFAPWTFTVTQEAASWACPQETSATVAADGMSAYEAFKIAASVGVAWTATSDADWLVVEGGGQIRYGSGDVKWKALSQTLMRSRKATITLRTQDTGDDRTWRFVVTQAAAPASLSAAQAQSTASGGTVSVDVLAADGVHWALGALPGWLTLSEEVSGVGKETVKFNVATNATFRERSATIMIAGSKFVVTQAAVQLEVLGGLTRYCDAQDETLSITVRVDVADAPWTIDIEEPAKGDWVLLNGEEEQSGDGTFELYVYYDEGKLPRTADVSIGSQVLKIVQAASSSYSTITYEDLKGATHANPAQYIEGLGVTLLAPETEVAGYVFAGWSPSVITKDMTGPQTVTAIWKANSYTIKYDANGGEGMTDPTACTYGADTEVATNGFSREGYDFIGWATEKDGEVVYAAGESVKNLVAEQGGSVTLYAVWKLITLSILDLKVTPVDPLGLAIDFRVRGAKTGDVDRSLEVSASVNGTNYVAKTLAGATSCVNGAHRIYWNMAADGLSLDTSAASVKVTYGPGEGALYCVVDLSAGASDGVRCPVVYMDAPPSSGFTNEVYKTTKLVLKRVDVESSDVLSQPFYMGLFEVTQKQWELVMGTNVCASTGYGTGDTYPAHSVSYDMIRGSSEGAKWPESNAVDLTSFLGVLRSKTGIDFDLPTAAQWEYACRAGTTTTYSYGDSANGEYMWYSQNAASSSHEVGVKKPNGWGFYDMHGNVYEWCLDGASSGNGRIIRGGGWLRGASMGTSSYSLYIESSNPGDDIGLRLWRPLQAVSGVDKVVATASNVACHAFAEGSEVEDTLTLGAAPTDGVNAVVKIDGVATVDASVATMKTWLAQPLGEHLISHTVGDVSISAVYEFVKRSSVSYSNLKGAANANPETYKEGIWITFADPSAVVGYTFAGWSPSAITPDMAGDLVVTASWTANSYTIKYDANGGEGTTDATPCTYDADAEVAANGFTRENYEFIGWATEKDGEVVYAAGGQVKNLVSEQNGSVTLYAVWKRIPLAISDLKVTPIEPLGVAIDYTVRGAAEEDANRLFEVTMSVNGTNYVAQTLAGATSCVNGAHRIYWNMAKDGLSLDTSAASVEVTYGSGDGALYCVVGLSAGASDGARCPVSYMDAPPEEGFTNEVYKTTKLVLKRVNAGTFIMGEDQTNEAHRVTLTKPFYMGLFEVTQEQWYQVTGSNPCSWLTDKVNAHS